MDARIYLISAAYVSPSKFRALAEGLIAAAPCRAQAVRLEASGDGLWHALDALTADGATKIELRPVGLPFSQSLQAWLPGAAGSWLAARGQAAAPQLLFAEPVQSDAAVLRQAARAQVALTPITAQPGGELGRGWDRPPAFRHHLLVCTGPRCHLKDAPNLLAALKVELGRAGMTGDCLVTSAGCLFPCNAGPVVVHYPAGNWYRIADLTDLRLFVAQALRAGTVPPSLLVHQTGDLHEIL